MNKLKPVIFRLIILLMILNLAVLFSGCKLQEMIFGRAKPENVLGKVDDIYFNNVKTFNLVGTAKLKENTSDVKSADLEIKGKIDKEQIKADLLFSGNLTYQNQSYKGGIGLKLLNNNLAYLLISDDLLTALQKSNILLKNINYADLKNKWIEFKNIEMPTKQEEKTALKSDQQNQLEKLTADTKLFTLIQEMPDEIINNLEMYHYKVSVNEAALKNLISKYAEIMGTPLSSFQNDSVQKVATVLANSPAEIWISKNTNYIYKFTTSVNLGENDKTASCDLELNLYDYNKVLTVEAPDQKDVIKAEDVEPKVENLPD